jgi:hypothetical protein
MEDIMSSQPAVVFGKQICPHCHMRFKNLEAHLAKRHSLFIGSGASPAAQQGNSSSAQAGASPQPSVEGKVIFVSAMSPGLTVVIRPESRGFINTAAGSISAVLPGLRVHFNKGILETSDPEVINYLDNIYKDNRFPITNLTKQKLLAQAI